MIFIIEYYNEYPIYSINTILMQEFCFSLLIPIPLHCKCSQVERCQEKIISLELQDPTTSLDSPSTENSSFDSQIAMQSAANTTLVSPSDDENSSIVTVRDNGEQLQLVDMGDSHRIDSDDDGDNVSHNSSERTSVLQTVVEVVNPLIAGDGSANQISIVRSSECPFPSLDQYGGDDADGNDLHSLQFESHSMDGSDEFELSLNDKMKTVLQELVENERVKLSFSKSITEDDDGDEDNDDDDEDTTDGTVKSDNNNDNSEWTTEEASLTEDNGNVFGGHAPSPSVDVKRIDDDSYTNKQNANAPDANEGDDEIITTTTTTTRIITTVHTSTMPADIESPISDEHIDAEQDDDDSVQETSAISATSMSASNATAISEGSSNKSTNNNNNKKKKRKNKAKKK